MGQNRPGRNTKRRLACTIMAKQQNEICLRKSNINKQRQWYSCTEERRRLYPAMIPEIHHSMWIHSPFIEDHFAAQKCWGVNWQVHLTWRRSMCRIEMPQQRLTKIWGGFVSAKEQENLWIFLHLVWKFALFCNQLVESSLFGYRRRSGQLPSSCFRACCHHWQILQ